MTRPHPGRQQAGARSSRRGRILVPVYASVIALALTLGAGSVVASAGGAPGSTPDSLKLADEKVTRAEAAAADARKQADDATQRADALQAQLDATGKGGTNASSVPGAKIVVQVTRADGSRLDPAAEGAVRISFTVAPDATKSRQGVKLDSDTGTFTDDRPPGTISKACVKQPDDWHVVELVTTPGDPSKRVVCVTYTQQPTPPSEDFPIVFKMEPGP